MCNGSSIEFQLAIHQVTTSDELLITKYPYKFLLRDRFINAVQHAIRRFAIANSLGKKKQKAYSEWPNKNCTCCIRCELQLFKTEWNLYKKMFRNFSRQKKWMLKRLLA